MNASDLTVVTARINPLQYKTPERLFTRFAEHVHDSGAKLIVAEVQHGDRPFIHANNPHLYKHVPLRARTVLWSKENALSLAMQHAPDAKYIMWADADIEWEQDTWAEQTIEKLQLYHWVQPWRQAIDMGKNGEVVHLHQSFGYQHHHGHSTKPGTKWAWSGGGGNRFPHPGFCHATTRQALAWTGGLLETGAMGSGDAHMMSAVVGEAEGTYDGRVSQAYKRNVLNWQTRAKLLNRSLSYCDMTIRHFHHGDKAKRQYQTRWDVLVKHDFDPDYDLKYNFGVLELTGNKPQLQHDIIRYFENRAEDE